MKDIGVYKPLLMKNHDDYKRLLMKKYKPLLMENTDDYKQLLMRNISYCL